MPRVVVSGYYGFHNEGDEAMLYAIVKALRERIPRLEIVVLSMDPDYTARQFGVKTVHRDSPSHIWQAIKKADLLVSGGGGLLQDVTGPNSILYYLGIAVMAKLLGKPVFFYGQGIGPVRTALGRTLMRLVVNRVNYITVRDAASRDELLSLGVRRPEIRVTADPVLGIDPSGVNLSRGKAVLRELGFRQRPVVGISVRPWKDLVEYRAAVARVAKDLVGRGFQILIVPMHHSADLPVSLEVAQLIGPGCRVLEKPYNYESLFEIIGNLDLLIGMRLHFLIFGAIFNVPMVGIAYDPKVSSFLKMINMPLGGYVETLKYEELIETVEKVLSRRSKISAELKERVAVLRRESLRGADQVIEVLKGDR